VLGNLIYIQYYTYVIVDDCEIFLSSIKKVIQNNSLIRIHYKVN